jgi:hypothetical protein
MLSTYRKVLVIAGLVFCLFSIVSAYSGGTGEPNDPYQIATVSDWNDLMNTPADWNDCFIMTANINLRGVVLTPVGNAINNFTGVFDGNGYIIRNIVINISDGNYVGLFGYMSGQSSEIKNLILISFDVNSGTGSYTGALAGYARKGTIDNCGAFFGSVSGKSYIGGLVGRCNANIYQSCFEGNVYGTNCIGGLAGQIFTGDPYLDNTTTKIKTCYSKGSVEGNQYAGGLIGSSYYLKSPIPEIYNCYSESSVSGSSYVGGFAGTPNADIYYSYSSGHVTATSYSGGFTGGQSVSSSLVYYCYWDIQTSGQNQSTSGQGKTTQEMYSISTFLSWGCDGVWTIDNGNDYPRLVWEGFPGQLIPTPIYGGGSGTINDPFLIYTPEQLNTIGLIPCHMNMHFKLMADIDLSNYTGIQFNIIGDSTWPFTGVFDGNGKKILNFSYLSDKWRDNTGLFGYLDGAEVKNVGLIEPNVVALSGYNTGALIGVPTNSKIIDCYVTGGIVKGGDTVGGLVGISTESQIEGCWTNCYVEGGSYVGGLAGQNDSSGIYNSYSISTVKGSKHVGGLVGRAYAAEIRRCFANGNVMGDRHIGGLVGWNQYSEIYDSYATGSVLATVFNAGGFAGNTDSGEFFRCYATGNVNCPQNIGGFIGYVYEDKAYFYDCFWNQTANPSITGVGTMEPDPAGVIGKTSVELQTEETFTAQGWDFSYNDGDEADWFIQIDEYPILVWQISPADIYTDGRNNFRDFAIFAQYWMREDCAIYNYYCDWADMNFNGSVDIDDLVVLMSYWLQSGIYE